MIHTSLFVDAAVGAAVVIAAAAVWAARRGRDRFAPVWRPLLAIIGGQSRAGRISGTYSGMPVEARIAEDGDGASFWELSLTLPGGGADWSLTYTGQKFLGSGTKAWRIKSKDEGVPVRMGDAGALDLVRQWPTYPEIDYKAKTGLLSYRENVGGPYAVPAPDAFRAQLDLLVKLAELNNLSAT
jgi:hypothetical protein